MNFGGILTIVSAHECIAIGPSQLSVHVLFAFLEGNVHISIHRLELSCNVDEFIAKSKPGAPLPLYTTPEFNLTVTGTPIISLRKADGSDAVEFSIFCLSRVTRRRVMLEGYHQHGNLDGRAGGSRGLTATVCGEGQKMYTYNTKPPYSTFNYR